MKYHCIKCDAVHEGPLTKGAMCGLPTLTWDQTPCDSVEFQRAERDRVIQSKDEIYRIGGKSYILSANGKRFLEYTKIKSK